MNDRIQKLAEQAHLYNDDDNFLTAALEHFAELIVRECANACDELAEKLSEQRPNSNYDAVAYECAEHIKTHFGVEE